MCLFIYTIKIMLSMVHTLCVCIPLCNYVIVYMYYTLYVCTDKIHCITIKHACKFQTFYADIPEKKHSRSSIFIKLCKSISNEMADNKTEDSNKITLSSKSHFKIKIPLHVE